MDHDGARRGGHGAMAPPLTLALLYCRYRYVLLKFQTPVCPFSTKNFAKVSVFLVKIRWRLGALPPDLLSLRRLGLRSQTLACGFPLPNPEWVSLISPLFLVSCFVHLSPLLFFSKLRFISNLNETPKFTVIFIICAKFGVKAGA